MKAGVAKALEQIKRAFQAHEILVAESACGGAYVIIEGVQIGDPFEQATSWVGLFLTNACPDADTYPFYVRADLSRKDKAALTSPLHKDHSWPPSAPGMPTREAVMISRRQNNKSCWGRETPLIKLQTVLKWLRTR